MIVTIESALQVGQEKYVVAFFSVESMDESSVSFFHICLLSGSEPTGSFFARV